MPSSEAARLVGERIRGERQRIGVSQMDLAGLAGINVAHFGRIERGETNPSLEILVRVASVLGVEAASLISGITAEQFPAGRPTYSAADFVRERAKRIG